MLGVTEGGFMDFVLALLWMGGRGENKIFILGVRDNNI